MRTGLGKTASSSRTAPTNRRPLRGSVLISLCRSPVSPIALLAALIRLNNADSEMARPCQTDAREVILADHTITVPDQVNKEIEDLGLDSHKVRSPP